MRDHNKLRAFELADRLAVEIYRLTKEFPREELFGLVSQMRRAAVSVPCNIVEGCARRTHDDYVHFLEVAYASARELDYQLSLALRLNYIDENNPAQALAAETCKVLNGLIRMLRSQGTVGQVS